MLLYAIPEIRFKERVIDDPIYKYVDSVNQIQQLVAQGASFRTAYEKISQKIQDGTYIPGSENGVYSHQGSLGQLNLVEIKNKLSTRLELFGAAGIREAESRLINGDHLEEHKL